MPNPNPPCPAPRFQAAIRKYGVPDEEIFQTADLFERRNISQVTLCIFALARIVSSIDSLIAIRLCAPSAPPTTRPSLAATVYRARKKGLYVVARNFFLLLLNFSAWPCLAVA